MVVNFSTLEMALIIEDRSFLGLRCKQLLCTVKFNNNNKDNNKIILMSSVSFTVGQFHDLSFNKHFIVHGS